MAYQAIRRDVGMPAWVIDITPNHSGIVPATEGLADTMSVIATGTSAWSCNDLKPYGTRTRSAATVRWRRTAESYTARSMPSWAKITNRLAVTPANDSKVLVR